MKSGIYEIVNLVNGNRYVGSAVDLRKRKSLHFSGLARGKHHNPHLQAAYSKYGKDEFRFDVVFQCDPENLAAAEQRVIDSYPKSLLYNIRKLATSNLGLRHGEDARKRIGTAHRGKTVSELTRERQSLSHQGNTHTDETRKKIAAFHQNRRRSDETRLNISEARRGKGLGNANKASGYPSFVDPEGQVHPAGSNLAEFCRTKGICRSLMVHVVSGRYKHHNGWTLAPKPPK